jgi:plastocyanin
MQGAVTVLPSNVETDLTPSTQAALDAAATAQYTTNTADALNAETAADNKAVANNADGTHTITMTAGTASAHVEVLEMLPSRVEVRPGDHVKWVTTTKSDIHTVTFPKGHGSDSVDPIPFVCETEGGADTPATGPPPNGCSSPGLFENHANPAPQGGTAISSTSTVATSGIISSPPAPFPNSYTFTFPTTGTFAYMCRIHDNMVGTIVVNPAEANNNPAVLAQTGRPLPHATPWALIVAAATLLAGGLLFGIRRRLDRI